MTSASRFIATAIGVLFLMAVFLSAHIMFSQEMPRLPDLPAVQSDGPIKLSDVDAMRTQIQLLVAENADLRKQLAESAVKITQLESTAFLKQLYGQYGLKPEEYSFDARTMAFVKIPAQAATKE